MLVDINHRFSHKYIEYYAKCLMQKMRIKFIYVAN